MRFCAPVLCLLALGAFAGSAHASRSLAQDVSGQPLAEWGAADAPAAAPAPASDGAGAEAPASAPLIPITTCTVTASSAVNRTEVDGSHARAQQGPMAVPDAFLGQALLSVHAPEGAGSEAVVEVVPAAGHTPVGPGGRASDAVPDTPTLRLTATLAANGTADVSYPARSYANDLTPQAVFVNGMPCAVVLAAASVPPSPPPTDETIPGLASFAAERPLTTRDGAIIGVDGKPLIVRGINWFGYENGQTNPDGLWGNVGNGEKGRVERERGNKGKGGDRQRHGRDTAEGRGLLFSPASLHLSRSLISSLPISSPRRRLCERRLAHAADGVQHHPPALLFPAV